MLHAPYHRWPRVVIGQKSALRKCVKCGVTFVATQAFQQTCKKCTRPNARTRSRP